MGAGKSDEAIQLLSETVKQHPSNAEARMDLGLFLGRQGKVEEARKQLRLAAELDSKNVPVIEAIYKALDEKQNARQ